MDTAGVCHAFTTVALPPLRFTRGAIIAVGDGAGLRALRAGTAGNQRRTVCALGLLRTANPVRPDGVHKRC